MPNYFKNIKSEAAAKERYRFLAQKHHPDKGGNQEKFQDLKKQYEEVLIYFRLHKELQVTNQAPAKQRPILKKEYAEQISNQAADIAGTAIKAGMEFLFEKFFSVK
jgi:DnaJ-class molecular chaperone